MLNLAFKKNIIGLLIVSALSGCEKNTPVNESGSFANIIKDATQEEIDTQKLSTMTEALKNPEWVSVSNLPNEWSGLYQKECKIGGPEDSNYFEYRNSKNNTVYHFSYTVFPSSLNKRPMAEVLPITYKVWQNENWPEHYLIFAQQSYSQLLLEDGWVKGVHQTLEGQPWDINRHWETKYRETDFVRWAVNFDEQDDYGSRPPCASKLTKPWIGQVFKTKDGQSLTIQKVMANL